MTTTISGTTGVSKVQSGAVAQASLSAGALIDDKGGGIGYGVGSGGTVTQPTSKSTGVTLNKLCGKLTTHNESLAAGVSTTFLVNNPQVSSNDTIIVVCENNGSYRVEAFLGASEYFYIRLTNITAGSLAEAVKINFAIIKGATA